jgi:glutamyl-Q tRNA(Asp) synthetase
MHRLQDPGRNQGAAGRLISPGLPADLPLSTEGRSSSHYRGRFAPTPSGPLHLGSLLTALASYLDAHAHRGEWHLRIDDLDTTRSRSGAVDSILRTLEALGLQWDGAIIHQSQRTERYNAALETLRSQDLLYACDCSRRILTDAAPSTEGSCPGRCRERSLPFHAGLTAWRIQAPSEPIRFRDRIKGDIQTFLRPTSGDFILYRRDQIHAYHLATVIDDDETGITDVVRGEDLLDATPQQIFLHEALSLPVPNYAHTPLLIRPDGRKLSKSEGAPPTQKEQSGIVLAYLMRCLGLPPPKTILGGAPEDLLEWAIEAWDLNTIRHIGTLIVEDNTIPSCPITSSS